jgi:hypothetical protein
MVDVKSLLVAAFYNTIRQFVQNILGGFGAQAVAGLNMADVVLLAIGYWKRDTWWGLGLLFGAVAKLGADLIPSTLFTTAGGGGGGGGSVGARATGTEAYGYVMW